MDRQDIAFTFLSTSVILGLALGIMFNPGILKEVVPNQQQEVHGHAMFFIYANGTELSLKAERFQLQSKEVHLENNRSHIVHKHKEGVTWKHFLNTVNIEINKTEANECLEMPKNRFCGNMTVMLNGKEYRPGKEIQQGDNLAIVFGENATQKAKAYMELDLPDAYKPVRVTERV